MSGWFRASLGLVQGLFKFYWGVFRVYLGLFRAIWSYLGFVLGLFKSVEGWIKVNVGIQGVYITIDR